MTKNTPQLLDVVALTVDLPEYNLLRGQVGTIVELLADSAAFEVEFSDSNGQIYQSVGLRAEQIMVLHFDPAPPNLVLEAE
ncbi:DUF4926 domain-containing protein [Anabaena aphanizomenioides LEGE 00250]|jgi:hypothetical protein|uniref:DUF4926 domain-containing protein n=1 Tax=Sphaerospermopsis aphanizomenoides LEGE 00250 TaxID=2777972 RepID=A0ABR9VEE8_9CYAN|nr:DUF4926 domain-containing protein [Sphaerospermopsis aphanizomenoides]MBE9236868.1 DUF4926 domain-containing protein [Sphaerospermopsis aphanizomenoides LEGE 00250]